MLDVVFATPPLALAMAMRIRSSPLRLPDIMRTRSVGRLIVRLSDCLDSCLFECLIV